MGALRGGVEVTRSDRLVHPNPYTPVQCWTLWTGNKNFLKDYLSKRHQSGHAMWWPSKIFPHVFWSKPDITWPHQNMLVIAAHHLGQVGRGGRGEESEGGRASHLSRDDARSALSTDRSPLDVYSLFQMNYSKMCTTKMIVWISFFSTYNCEFTQYYCGKIERNSAQQML